MPLPATIVKILTSLDVEPLPNIKEIHNLRTVIHWLQGIASTFESARIHKSCWPEAAINLMPKGQLSSVMEGIQNVESEALDDDWQWKRFEGDMERETRRIVDSDSSRISYCHPALAMTVGTSLITIGGQAVANLVGFGGAGRSKRALAMTAIPSSAPAFTGGVAGIGGGVTFVARTTGDLMCKGRSRL